MFRPEHADHSVIILLLRSNGVRYLQTFDDTWFSVRTPRYYDNLTGVLSTGYVRYQPDRFVNFISCKESIRYCSTLSDRCTPWSSLINSNITKAWSDVAALTPPRLQNGISYYLETANLCQFVKVAAMYTSIPDSIGECPASSALQAAHYLYGDTQAYLAPKQWKLELEYWFAMALARLQLEIFNTDEKPPGVDESVTYNMWAVTEMKGLCGKVKFHSPNHTNLSTVDITLILVVVVLLTIGSTIDVVLGWVSMDWARKMAKDWDTLENLSLLEDAEKWRSENGQSGTIESVTEEA